MSTDINIKKKISIEEEGALLTADVNNINFVGPGVTASTLGNDVTVTVAGSIGGTVYYMNETVTQAPYKEFSSNPTSAVEQVIPATVAGGATATIAAYQTPVGVPNTTVIPAGLWQLFLHFNAGSAGQNWIIRPYVYKRDLGGIETLIFTPDPQIVTGMSTTTTMYTCDGVFPNTTLLTTDRIVVKIDVENTSGVSQTVNFRTEGSQHYSVAATTLNQAISAGSVTSVSGTAPIVSSGGSAPAISIPQATALVDGYLSSSDWSVFNAKVPATRNLTINGTTYDLSADRTWTVSAASGIFGISDALGVYTYYATLTLALAAASSGQTIEMFADYVEAGAVTVALKDGVTINGNGHTYSHTSATATPSIKMNVNGNYNILNTNVVRTNALAGGYALYSTPDLYPGQPALVVNCNLAGSTFSSNTACILSSNSDTINYYGGTVLMTTGSGNGVQAPAGFFNNMTILGTSGFNGSLVTSASVNNSIIINRGSSITTVNVSLSSTTLYSFASLAVSGSYNISNSFVYSASGVAVVPFNNFISYNSVFYSAGSAAMFLNNSNATFDLCKFISTSSNAISAFTGGTLTFNNCMITSSAAASIVSTGTILKIFNTTVDCTWNNATGRALTVASASILTNSVLKVTNTSANCIYATAAQTVSYCNNTFVGATTPINANITQGMVNTDDAYGNVTI